jgi:hypothetical protein
MMGELPPAGEAGAWHAVQTVRLLVAERVWVVAFALTRQPAGWYVRLLRYPEPNPAARYVTVAGPFADAAGAGAGAAALVHRMMVALDQQEEN